MKNLEIEVTGGNIRQGHFYINRDSGVLPSECWGGKNKFYAGKQVQLSYEGDSDVIDTDFDGTKRIPRKGRPKCRKFFERYGINAGDKVYLIKISEYKYFVSKSCPS